MTLLGTSGAMLACLGVRACVFRPAALLQRGHARCLPRHPPRSFATTATRNAHPPSQLCLTSRWWWMAIASTLKRFCRAGRRAAHR